MNQRFVVLLAMTACVLLAMVLIVYSKPAARGHYVYVLNDPHRREPCGDGRPVVLKIRGDGQAEINKTALPRNVVTKRMEQIYAKRCVRALFLMADSDVPFEDVVGEIGELQSRIAYLNIALVTREEQLTKGCGPEIRHTEELRLPNCYTDGIRP